METLKLNTTQQRVFDFMLEEGGITSLNAFVELGEKGSGIYWDLQKKSCRLGKKCH